MKNNSYRTVFKSLNFLTSSYLFIRDMTGQEDRQTVFVQGPITFAVNVRHSIHCYINIDLHGSSNNLMLNFVSV